MDAAEMKVVLGALLADEPPFRADVERTLAKAQRRRRHRMITRIAVTASAAAIVSAVAIVPVRDAHEQDVATPALNLLSLASNGNGGASIATREETRPRSLKSLLPVIEANSPDGLVFDLSAAELPGGEMLIDGTVDDGDGPGRLFIAMSSESGSTVTDPCSDDEFRQGASCTTEILDDGSRLILRGVVTFEDVSTLAAVLVHPDGSGVYAESGDWSPGAAPRPVEQGTEQQDVASPSVTRSGPVYTTEQLATLIRAIDAEQSTSE